MLSLSILQSILCLIFLIYSPISIFIPNISIFIIDLMVLCYMYQSSLMILGTSHNPLLSVQFMLSFSTHMVVLSMTLFCKWNHILYFYLHFLRCIFYIQYLLSPIMILLPVIVIMSFEFSHLLYNLQEVGPEYFFSFDNYNFLFI